MHPNPAAASIELLRHDDACGSRLLQVGGLVLDLDLREARVDGRVVPLSANEFSSLLALARCPNVPMTKDAVASSFPSGSGAIDPRMIDVYVGRARRKLDAAGVGPMIFSIPGRGYAVFRADGKRAEAASGDGRDPVLVAA